MKTPEQIAERFANGLVGDNTTATVQRSMLVETIANAVKEVQHEPQFKPEGEPDDWRDDAENIGDADHVEVGWEVRDEGGRCMFATNFILTAEQARGVLAYLSETSES